MSATAASRGRAGTSEPFQSADVPRREREGRHDQHGLRLGHQGDGERHAGRRVPVPVEQHETRDRRQHDQRVQVAQRLGVEDGRRIRPVGEGGPSGGRRRDLVADDPVEQPGQRQARRQARQLHRDRQAPVVDEAGHRLAVQHADRAELVERDRRVVHRRVLPAELQHAADRRVAAHPVHAVTSFEALKLQTFQTCTSPVPGSGRAATRSSVASTSTAQNNERGTAAQVSTPSVAGGLRRFRADRDRARRGQRLAHPSDGAAHAQRGVEDRAHADPARQAVARHRVEAGRGDAAAAAAVRRAAELARRDRGARGRRTGSRSSAQTCSAPGDAGGLASASSMPFGILSEGYFTRSRINSAMTVSRSSRVRHSSEYSPTCGV